MSLPLLLAGPILRRVESAQVSVWVALRDPCHVRLSVWEGRAASGRPTPLAQSPDTVALRVGVQLHVVVVTVKIPDTAGVSFQPDALYSYDLEIRPIGSDTVHTLGTLHMLEEGIFDGFRRLPLGFEPGLLPSFAPPPSALTDLNVLYGSCRRPGHPTVDALAMVDDLIFGDDRYKDARKRPHQLFLGGDQIYADDVQGLHMLVIEEAAVPLIGIPGGPSSDPVPIEHLPLDEILTRVDASKAKDPHPLEGYAPEGPPTGPPSTVDPFRSYLPADRVHFPEGRRLHMTQRDAQLTSVDGDSHLLSLGEFAATYLSVWSPAIWGENVIRARFAADGGDPANRVPPSALRTFRWDEELPPYVTGARTEGAIVMPAIEFPERIPGHLYIPPTAEELEEAAKREQEPEEKKKTRAVDEAFAKQKGLRRSFEILQEFVRNLPKVQRALANVPTYMIFDDHDFTDDVFLNPVWRDRVLTKKLGQAFMGNAMIAYALFQDWGNVPVDYESGPKAQLLSLVRQLFPVGAIKGPVFEAFDQIATLCGHDQDLVELPTGRFQSANPPLKWHFMIDGPRHRTVVFDNRTRRSYGSKDGPPGNVSVEALVDQLPLPPLPAGREVLVVVAPLQVIGAPVLDDIVAPLVYRIYDAVKAKDKNGLLSASSGTGHREMPGTHPDAIEAWAFDAETFEHLMKRLEPYGRVVLLSGDVHYASGTAMSYWRGSAARPARFAQFTSSGFKNVMPSYITFLDRAGNFAQQLIRANLGTERLGWEQPVPDPVLLPIDMSEVDLLPGMRSRLRETPMRLPTWGWPDLNDPAQPDAYEVGKSSRLNPLRPPDWRWRVTPLRDTRDDAERPAPIRELPLDEAEVTAKLADPSTVLDGYQLIAARHQHALGRLRNARQILFRGNVGRLRFEAPETGKIDAVHEVYTTFSDPSTPVLAEPAVEPYMVQVAPLGPLDEEPPGRLRTRALEIIPPTTGGA
jgi:hypothetical protein